MEGSEKASLSLKTGEGAGVEGMTAEGGGGRGGEAEAIRAGGGDGLGSRKAGGADLKGIRDAAYGLAMGGGGRSAKKAGERTEENER